MYVLSGYNRYYVLKKIVSAQVAASFLAPNFFIELHMLNWTVEYNFAWDFAIVPRAHVDVISWMDWKD